MKRTLFVLILATLSLTAYSQNAAPADSARWKPDATVAYTTYPEQSLEMDVFYPQEKSGADRRCVVFIYGGGFINNNLRSSSTQSFCRRLADDGYVAIAIDYRLGLKGQVFKSKIGMIKPLGNAVSLAVEDCSKALSYIIAHAGELGIDPASIILCGSSAGAITALQTDYEICNRTANVKSLPEDFHPAGVVSFAGAIFSTDGKVKYKYGTPAPTLMLHGTADSLVPYDRIAMFGIRFSGSNDLVKVFKENHYPHLLIRYVGEGHGVSARMTDSYEQFIWFVDNFVAARHNYEMDITWNDHDHIPVDWDNSQPDDLYK
ncbi:MAG: alpha/beta hydrolase [Bacteroidales bacterium]|nr:alpha/beta hydrolase [Candidatus Cacconaster merdequi]